ncbi:hypothetical protein KRP22_010844 [Phytophthora ramorum]|nr:hypothetical protein KRP22_5284 [Phytophthora ramorum]
MWIDTDAPSSLQQSARLQRMQWADAMLVCFVVVFLCSSYLFCFLYRRCCLRKQRHHQMARVPSATMMESDMEEPLLGVTNYDPLPTIDPIPLSHEYQPSAPPLSWESEQVFVQATASQQVASQLRNI